MGGGLDSRCVVRVCGADGAARYHPHRTPFLPSLPYVCGSASHNTFELRDCLSLQCSLL